MDPQIRVMCDESFADAYVRNDHRKTLHNCSFCNKTFAQLHDLKLHLHRIHTGEKPPYHCGVCNKAFHWTCDLKRHMLSHNGEKPHRCAECNRTFAHAFRIREHMLIHTGMKPNQCTVCNRRFAHASTLKQHMYPYREEAISMCHNPYYIDVPCVIEDFQFQVIVTSIW